MGFWQRADANRQSFRKRPGKRRAIIGFEKIVEL